MGTRPTIDAPDGLSAWRFDLDGDAFALLEWPTSSSTAPKRLVALTPAEAAVATRAAAGRSNADIAQERRCSERTVANLIGRAFRKLGVHSRAELIAAFAARR